MINIGEGSVILERRTGVEFENKGVLNPAAIEKDGITHMFYRAVDSFNVSTIGYCQIKDEKVINRPEKPVLVPEFDYEKKGMEDPRITLFEGKYYMLYTAYDGKNALVAYAVSDDLVSWEKKGTITPQMSYDRAEDIFKKNKLDLRYGIFERWYRTSLGDDVKLWEKDALLFPRRINGKMAMIHRVLPGIQICFFDKFEDLTEEYWEKYLEKLNDYIVIEPKERFEGAYVGGGCVPLETNDGWLLIYHGVQIEDRQRVYRAGALLLDKENPQIILGRLPYPLFSPTKEWEKQGIVNNVVFPTGAMVEDATLKIYYGAADLRIGMKAVELKSLLGELNKCRY